MIKTDSNTEDSIGNTDERNVIITKPQYTNIIDCLIYFGLPLKLMSYSIEKI